MPRQFITATRTWNSFPWTRRLAASEKKGGRKHAVIAQPGLQEAIEEAVATQTAGSPVDERIRWTNRSPAEIASEVVAQGFSICADTVRNILTEELGLRRRQAVKDEAACNFPQRDEQFRHIARLRARYERAAGR